MPRKYPANRKKVQHVLSTHCKRGHEFTPENTYIRGWRNCMECTRIRGALYYRRRNPVVRRKGRKARTKRDFPRAERPTTDQRIEWERILRAEGLGMSEGTNQWKLFYGKDRA